jgi:hypothetical protein
MSTASAIAELEKQIVELLRKHGDKFKNEVIVAFSKQILLNCHLKILASGHGWTD